MFLHHHHLLFPPKISVLRCFFFHDFLFDAEAVHYITVNQLWISMASLIITSSSRSFGFNFPYHKSVSFHHSFSSFSFKNSNRLSSLIAAKYSTPQNPNSRWGNYISHIKNISVLFPIFKKFKDFASGNKWVSVSQECNCSESFPDEFDGSLLQNGALGMALLSVTSTAKVKISPFVATLAANPTFMSGLFALAIAQSTKVFLNFWVERKWDLRILFSCGGMPSSHSALCTALTTSVAICHGVADSLFPVCLGFSLIVMYDAIGVRRHAGMQAEVLNLIVEVLFQGHPVSERKLKELLGHTPLQVVAGALLGMLVAWFCCQSCAIAI